MNGYAELGSPRGTIYVRKASKPRLEVVDALVFDCDGVLIDIRESYGRCVAAQTATLVEALTGAAFDPTEIDDDVIYAYKSLGGFNNDWDLVYTLTLLITRSLPEETQSLAEKISTKSTKITNPAERLKYISTQPKPPKTITDFKQLLIGESGKLDSAGTRSTDRLLGSTLAETRKALAYPKPVGESIIATQFEEMFSGPKLYTETWGLKPIFDTKSEPYVNREKVEVKQETFDALATIIGGKKFGIASGSAENTAKHVLGKAADNLTPQAEVWYETVEKASRETGKPLGKPNPYSLQRSASTLEPFKTVLYVGDGISDMLTSKNAMRIDDRNAFAGVYALNTPSEASKIRFLQDGADIVAPTVNELPTALTWAKKAQK